LPSVSKSLVDDLGPILLSGISQANSCMISTLAISLQAVVTVRLIHMTEEIDVMHGHGF
jgi:hypothetical protein